MSILVAGQAHCGNLPALAIALVVPGALLAGALAFEHLGGLPPCELCLWQRWPLVVAMVLAVVAALARTAGLRRILLQGAGAGMIVSAAIAVMHVGVEQGWWEGPTRCSASGPVGAGDDFVGAMLATPLIRCDQAPWQLLGISLAGFNLLFSGLGGIAVVVLSARDRL